MPDFPKSISSLKPLVLVFCCLLPVLAIIEFRSNRSKQATLDKMSSEIDALEKKLLRVKADVNNAVTEQQSLAIDNDVLLATLNKIMSAQQQAWNRGDLDEFMKPYWNSPDLTFSSRGKTTRGWQATFENYQKKYPTPEKMGQLSFDNLKATALGADGALVLGEWQLARKSDDDLGGNFSLVFRRIEGRWLIIHDHSSSLKATEISETANAE